MLWKGREHYRAKRAWSERSNVCSARSLSRCDWQEHVRAEGPKFMKNGDPISHFTAMPPPPIMTKRTLLGQLGSRSQCRRCICGR